MNTPQQSRPVPAPHGDRVSDSTGNAAAFYMARQPILDRDQRIHGYELLFRDNMTNAADIRNGDAATSRVILNSFVDVGIDRLVGNSLGFFNLTRKLLLRHKDFPFPNTHVAFEVLEDVEVDDQLLYAVEDLAKQGFTIALDDFFFRANVERLIELAHLVKVDILDHTPAELEALVARLRRYQVQLVAEKVETQAQYEHCRELGFEYFQGYYLCRPEMLSGKALPDSKISVLRLLAQLQDPNVGPKELDSIIRNDVALTYKLLRCVNSAYFGVPLKITSISHAIVYLGLDMIRNWARLVTLAGLADRPPALVKFALTRARMAELLAANLAASARDAAFTVGLFSLLDALLKTPMEDVLARVSLSDDINRALLDGQGPYGPILAIARAYEQADWDTVDSSRFSRESVTRAYVEAAGWADDVYAASAQ
jgi:EAL and modified HD-GYP domain-containing signal transduction protein